VAGRVTINILSDDVLLCIFYFVQFAVNRLWRLTWWHRLVHVCRRWRFIIFESPNTLNLKIISTPWTPAQLLGIWPPLPILITNTLANTIDRPLFHYHFDAAIMHRNRVCEIDLCLSRSKLQQMVSMMQEQFPALIHLELMSSCRGHRIPALPDGFLCGSAPRLQSLTLISIPFPALPKLLLSTTDLVDLTLWDIPHSGYISPEVIVPHLAMLANLESLIIEFPSFLSRPDTESRRPPLPTRTILPTLTLFEFKGVNKYLEDFVARIDAPLLDSIGITFKFFHRSIFDIPVLAQFIRRTRRFQALNEAHVDFGCNIVDVRSLPPTRIFDEKLGLRITCNDVVWDPSSVAQVFTLFFPSVYTVEHLYVYGAGYLEDLDDIESMQWPEIFHTFTAVKSLYVSEAFAQYIAPAMQGLGERAVDMLPALESLFLEEFRVSGLLQDAFGQFLAARQLLGHPVAVSRWSAHH
jgi:hypothetical protein